MCDFYPGQEVVCVDADGPGLYDKPLREGAVYTVRWVGKYLCPRFGEIHPSIRLLEVLREPCPVTGVDDLPFRVSRFRPVQRKSLPECLTRLLDTPIEREVERA